MNDRQKEQIRKSWQEARAGGFELVTFWQDHFYTRNGKFGYPVCIQVLNRAENKVEISRILHWSSSKSICDALVAAADQFITELDTVGEVQS